MNAKIYSVVATESGQASLKSVRQSLRMIETELQKYDSVRHLTCEDAQAIKALDGELISAFESITEAGY